MSQDGTTLFAIGNWTGEVELMSISGQKVGGFEKSGQDKMAYSVEYLPKGIYIAHIHIGDKVFAKKFIR